MEAAAGRARNDLQPAYRIEMLPILQLKPAARRVRKTNARHLAKMVESVKAFGPLPILIDQDDGIIDGHIVVEAAKLERLALGEPDSVQRQEWTGRGGAPLPFTLEAVVTAARELVRLGPPSSEI